MAKIRRQLTLFIDQGDAQIIEMIRAEFNPLQHQLIKSHVTLCREDELNRLKQSSKISPPSTADLSQSTLARQSDFRTGWAY